MCSILIERKRLGSAGIDLGTSMELVIEYWPENEHAVYAAALAAYQRGDPRARVHLEPFLRLDLEPTEMTDTVNVLLGDLRSSRMVDCSVPIAKDGAGHVIFPGRCQRPRAR